MQTPESESRSIVLLGSFNPAIFQPMWFVHAGLLDKEDVENDEITKINIITRDIAIFTIDAGIQFRLEVQKGRFAATSSKPTSWIEIRDLVTQTFEILEHTPIKQLGINRDVHYKIESSERWREIGDILAPKDSWGLLQEPKTLELVVQGQRTDTDAKYIRTNVLPSPLFPGKNVLLIRTNEHYEWDSEIPAKEAAQTLSRNWDDAYDFSRKLGESILLTEAKS